MNSYVNAWRIFFVSRSYEYWYGWCGRSSLVKKHAVFGSVVSYLFLKSIFETYLIPLGNVNCHMRFVKDMWSWWNCCWCFGYRPMTIVMMPISIWIGTTSVCICECIKSAKKNMWLPILCCFWMPRSFHSYRSWFLTHESASLCCNVC